MQLIPDIKQSDLCKHVELNETLEGGRVSPSLDRSTRYSTSGYHQARHEVSEEAFKLIAKYRAEKFQKFISPTDHVLEFGCGPGWNLTHLQAGRKVGCDVATQYAPSLRANGIEFSSSLAELDGQKFDVVLTSHVLEHLVEPGSTLHNLGHFLKSDGRLVVIVPFDRQQRRHDPKNNNHHLYIWDVHTFTELARACGYRVESATVARYGFDRFAARLAARNPFSTNGIYRLLLSALRLIRPGYEIRMVLKLTPPQVMQGYSSKNPSERAGTSQR